MLAQPPSPFNSSILNIPAPSKEPGQRSLNISDLFLLRWTPPWSRPPSLPAYTWRAWVLNQPVATVCKETLIASLLSLDWKITPADMSYREELAPTIRYYTKLLEHGGEYLGTDYTGLCEWILGDLLDLPFGAAAELGRKNDAPNGRVQWIRPLDAGTLYPTLNLDFPIVQYYQGYQAVAFPNWNIARTYLNPRQEIFREGWGMAPPEKVYFAIDLLTKGDKYYANLLLDIPPVGVFDLGDMEKDSALEWVQAFQLFTAGTTDSFKIPVLYEHTKDAKFIPFGKAPNDIMFDHITLKYAAMVAAAYGVSLNDIGLQTTSRSGETLAGAIRSERRTAKTGMARIKTKFRNFINTILPDNIQFDFIELDTETTMAMGRARLASTTAFNVMLMAGAMNAQEFRSQMIQDGLITISIPEDLPKDAKPMLPQGGNGKPKERPGLLGYPTPPSQGGNGEAALKSLAIKKEKRFAKHMNDMVDSLTRQVAPAVYETMLSISEDEIDVWKSVLADSIFDASNINGVFGQIFDTVSKSRPIAKLTFKGLEAEIQKCALDQVLSNPDLTETQKVNLEERLDKVGYSEMAAELEQNINNRLNGFLAQASVVMMNDLIFGGQVPEPNEDEIDKAETSHYDYIVTTIQEKMLGSLEELIQAHVITEFENTIEKIGEKVYGK